ncbi:sll0376 [Synechocystis sp. PCC 6803]|jgi:hypothetical protein|uniref:Sll0376 protein n=1 Tax=Synechocystis sp. (strain ATCC 27184 / PCC 6803 / Kazusa) TaxID=1111708 RepID=Q55751_SYNY3|nr:MULTISPECIES: hypothetical protein [unclassified Synechocystis]WLT38586.1 hypothetical protein NON20_01715 [Synechocystis sp. B12]BAM54013.1 hypothetical protein BEST7613_5082 [Synechocystis sp. PCC 6803] [Bacillus subtilis BEST7613]AGF52688.1 hypothetical protein MYO_124580 [Synechocystis sp. PCC 6803]ALJ68608.1 hypothetical protein AOY38_12640 [Synechocystis sp. PCC 6803]AVP90456.1 hypothetical protein C7I86_12720 [Synechocystis sp. IPPAS B-1465]
MTPSDYQDQEVKTPKVEVVDSYDTGDDGITDAARRYWLQFQQWFDNLPLPAKGAVAIAVLFVAFSVLTQVLKFVASLVTLAILLVILYGVYRVFLRQDKGN